MAGNRAEIRIVQNARVWLAAVGTAAPADATVAMPVGWRDVGFFVPDTMTFATDPSFEEVRSHQANYPTRRFQTEDAATAGVDMQQWNSSNWKAVFGGGTITSIAGTPTQYRFSPPQIGGRTSVAACLEMIDGELKYRRIIPLCDQTEGVEQAFNKTEASILPLRLAVTGSDIGDPWYDLTNDPSFANMTGA